MSDNRSQQNTHDTGSSASRARDDLRTASKKQKPKDQRSEGRDKKDASIKVMPIHAHYWDPKSNKLVTLLKMGVSNLTF